MNRRNSFLALVLAVAPLVAPLAASADEYPNKPIRIVLGFPPGGGTDAVFRAIQVPLEKELRQTLLPDYRPGAGGTLAAERLARAQADGYTLSLVDNGPLTIAPALKQQSYDPLKSFSYISILALGGMGVILTPKQSPIRSVKDLIQQAKEAPGTIGYATSGIGSGPHLVAEMLQMTAGIKLNHIPFKGGAQVMQDIMGGQVPMAFATSASVIALRDSGRFNVLAALGPARMSALPDVPTLQELGIPVNGVVWYALVGPKGLSKPVEARLNAAVQRALQDKSVVEALRVTGYEATYIPNPKMTAQVEGDLKKWDGVARAAQIPKEQ
ncbi:tripartite tricarboxylate transporter substrate binding protein [Variovorax paradoxus]|nr:tripartite tricarboxylate transporter substrate binding protein [Variovorax paradoxus]MBT2304871.1 tripartite tricarboxylate transporter substrate binding protein [Variovorax paradoxus]